MKKIYETTMINHGGREGEVEAPNGSLHLKVSTPGTGKEGTNPEQLFAAGYAACFNSALQHILEAENIKADSEVKVRVSLYSTDDGGFQIGAVIETHIEGMDESDVKKYAEKAHTFCPYSKATQGNIEVEVVAV